MKIALAFGLGVAAAVLSGCATPTSNAPSAAVPVRQESCQPISTEEVAALFDRWNRSLQTGDAHQVAAQYAPRSILLPTLSNQPRLSAAEKEDYFHHFLEDQPSGRIDMRHVEVGCNTVLDAGLYTFSFARTGARVSGRYSFTYGWNGKDWRITSHHSSVLPEKR